MTRLASKAQTQRATSQASRPRCVRMGTSIKHFALEDWTDFVRQLKSRPVMASMQQHLDEGCKQCSKVVRMWRDFLAFGSNERLCLPPERSVRSVRGYYGLLKPARQGRRIAAMARLVFDSFLEPEPAGIRSSQSAPRQLMYSAGKLLVDLRVERRLGSFFVVGQAQRRSLRGPRLAGREVIVLQGTKTVARTRCNRFGEFQFELEAEDNGEFAIVLRGPVSFVMPLRGAAFLQKGS